MSNSLIDTLYNTQLENLKASIANFNGDLVAKVVTVGEDPASQIYVRNKIRLFEELGMTLVHERLDADARQELLDIATHAYDSPTMVQLPIPPHLTTPDIPAALDIDGFCREALGNIMNGDAVVLPCTVQAILDIIEKWIEFKGTRVAIVGRSPIVGKPLAVELINRQSTITSFNSESDLEQVDWQMFDVIVVAAGHYGVVKASQFDDQQLVIDVGINRRDGKIVGDVEYDTENVEAEITPVPNGIGKLTVLNVARNTLKLAEMTSQHKPNEIRLSTVQKKLIHDLLERSDCAGDVIINPEPIVAQQASEFKLYPMKVTLNYTGEREIYPITIPLGRPIASIAFGN